jgi:rod shape-determining protein MreD
MLGALLHSPLPRLIPIGLVLLALQKTLFVEIQPFGVILQIVMAFAAAAGAAGGAERGMIAAFVLGIMFDLAVGTPLGSTALAMGVAAYVAGWVDQIRIDTTWWLAAIFVGAGAGAGEATVPVIRRFTGEEDAFVADLATIVPVVAVGAAIVSIPLMPVARWALGIAPPEWKIPVDA